MNLELNENLVAKGEKKLTNKNNNSNFRLSGKNFFLTYPRCLLEKQDVQEFILSLIGCEYLLVAKEAHKDGTPHIHVFLTAKKKVQTRSSTYFDIGGYHGNYQSARDSDDVIQYVRKSDSEPLEYGIYVGNNQSVVQKRALQNKLMLAMPTHQLVDDGIIHISQYKQIKEAIQMYNIDKTVVPDYMPKTCVWIYGKTGTGKSRYIRDNYPNQAYFKPQNKWWDGYHGQKIVLIDDFDLSGQCLGHYLKIWADCYSFVAEVKGSTLKPVIEKFYITSQYLPRDIWCQGKDQDKWDDEMRKAIERRFRVVEVINGELVDYIN